jgi:hypothetical protein
VVHTSRGLPVHYDRLVIATGATMRPQEIPGLDEHAHQVWTPGQMHRLGEAVRRVARLAAHGRPQRVLFVVPPNNKCAGPLYEIVFMLDTWLRRRNARRAVDITPGSRNSIGSRPISRSSGSPPPDDAGSAQRPGRACLWFSVRSARGRKSMRAVVHAVDRLTAAANSKRRGGWMIPL